MKDLNMLFELFCNNDAHLHIVSCLLVREQMIYSRNLEALPL